MRRCAVLLQGRSATTTADQRLQRAPEDLMDTAELLRAACGGRYHMVGGTQVRCAGGATGPQSTDRPSPPVNPYGRTAKGRWCRRRQICARRWLAPQIFARGGGFAVHPQPRRQDPPFRRDVRERDRFPRRAMCGESLDVGLPARQRRQQPKARPGRRGGGEVSDGRDRVATVYPSPPAPGTRGRVCCRDRE